MKLIFSILRSDASAKEYTCEADKVTFGRADDCEVVLDSDIVSGRHAYIEPYLDRYRLCDLDSTNGTKLNGLSVTGSVYIQPDAEIEFGDGGPRIKILALEESVAPSAAAEPAVAEESDGSTASDNDRGDCSGNGLVSKNSIIATAVAAILLILAFFLWPRTDENETQSAQSDLASTGEAVREESAAGQTPASDLKREPSFRTEREGTSYRNDQREAKASQPEAFSSSEADVLNTAKSRLVWIGIRTGEGQKQSVVPLCSGWCLSNSEIVTAADAVAPLAGNEERAVVYSELLTDDSYLPVQKITFPKPYTAKDTTFDVRQQNNVARILLADALPLPNDATPGPLSEAEWRHAVSKGSSLKLLRCGFEIPSDEQRVSSVNMPKITSSFIHVTGAAKSNGGKHLPVMKCVGQPSKESITGQLIVQQDGRPLGTAVQLSATEFQLVPADRLEHYKFAEAAKHEVADLEDELSLEERRQQLAQRVAKIRELRDWAFQRFDEPTRGKTRIDNFSEKVTEARTIRRDVLSHLINLPPSENTKDIWSGKGMNVLLDHLGPVALQHAERLQGVSGESLTETADPDKMQYLANLANGLRVPKMHLMNIQCQQGMTGQPLQVELAFDREIRQQILLLDWPAWFRLNKEFHQPLKRIEAARDAYIKSAGSGDYSAAVELQHAVESIEQKFAEASRSHYVSLGQRISEGKKASKNMGTREIYRAKAFLQTLRYSIGRFIEIDHFPDNDQYLIQLQDYEHPNGIPIVILLAAMQERGLRFAKATRSSELSRGFIFDSMRDYYVDLFSLYATIQDAESQAELVQKSHSLNILDEIVGFFGSRDLSFSFFDKKLGVKLEKAP